MVFESDYWFATFLFKRGIGLVYLIAFAVALRQFRPLIGENGITPFTEFVEKVDFRKSPSIFHYLKTDRAMRSACWIGILLSLSALTGFLDLFGTAVSMLGWLAMWILYLSIVNVGQVWWGYGWESKLLEAGILAVFLGGFGVSSSLIMILLIRWMLFRVMFGAGLIKIRGDSCWRKLNCLNFHYETQPMPNPLSWFLHKMPESWHKMETLITHFTQLIIPLLYFAPQPVAAIAGVITIFFHLALMAGGNYSWLNLISIVLAFSLFPDTILSTIIPLAKPALSPIKLPHQLMIYSYAVLVTGLSYYPVRNMLSSKQVMNTSFDPLHLVNTYGAFGSITKERYEVVIEGRNQGGEWKEYEFPGKPTDTRKMPPQVAPYHMRLDWQLWFAAMTPRPRRRWFQGFIHKLLKGDEDIDRLLEKNPFPEGPDMIRAKRYRYEFSSWQELRQEGKWWRREEVGTFFPKVRKSLE
ncbi:MAG: lipase maturation factor family protein [Candidatus Nanohaloarchaea archaeon]